MLLILYVACQAARAIWPDTISGLVPQNTLNFTVTNAVPAQHTNCSYSEAMVGALPRQPCFLRDDLRDICNTVFANWSPHILLGTTNNFRPNARDPPRTRLNNTTSQFSLPSTGDPCIIHKKWTRRVRMQTQ